MVVLRLGNGRTRALRRQSGSDYGAGAPLVKGDVGGSGLIGPVHLCGITGLITSAVVS